jgi:bifunctional DNA primase/polymerase-like protein
MNANWFREHGVHVFPVQRGTKQPDTRGQSWKGWTLPFPHLSYGVELGSLIVVDGDSAATTAWIRQHCPTTPFRVQTGPHHDGSLGRGVHFYFRAPDTQTPAFIHRDGLSIEARRLGQYVLGPGSVHPTGCVYTASKWWWHWEDLPIFPADFLFNDGSGVVSAPESAYAEPNGTVGQGERTAELFRYVRHLKANDIARELAFDAMVIFNEEHCDPPKSTTWLRSWFGRAWQHPFPAQREWPTRNVPLTEVSDV